MSKHSERRAINAASQGEIDLALSGAMEIAAALEGVTKGPRAFSMLAYSGGKLEVGNYPLPVVIDIKGAFWNAKQVPIYFGHHNGSDGSKLLGHIAKIDKSATSIAATGAISAANEYVAQVLAAHDNGYEWQASIGALPVRGSLSEIPTGKTITVNGQQQTGPFILAKKTLLRHVAVLPEGADSTTTVTIAASAAQSERTNSMEFTQWVNALFGGAAPELTDAQNASLKSRYEAEVKAAAVKPIEAGVKPGVTAPAFDLSALCLTYEKHVATIQAKASTYTGKIDASKLAEINAAAGQKAAELKAEALNGEKPAAWLEVALVKAQADAEVAMIRAERPKAPAIHGSTHDQSPLVIEAALCQAINSPDIEKRFDDKTLQAAHTQFRSRIGLQQMLIMAAAANGYQCSIGERVHTGNIRDVLRHAMMIQASSTYSLPGILSNVAAKELLAGYEDGDDTWKEISAIKPVNDFKSITSYRMLDNMEYEEIQPDGTMKHGQLSEESYTRTAKTYAKMFALPRTDIINDDLGAFNDLRNRLGRGAKQKFLSVFWAKFLANSSFFTAARANYITGSTTNLGTDGVGLALGLAAFDALRSPAVAPAKVGYRIGGTPTILLTPPELSAIAMQLFTPVAAVETAKVNVYAGKYRPVKVAQLSDSNITGYSATAWYLLRNPSVLPAVVVSFLGNVQAPVIESADADFDTLGIQFRGYHDFGVDQAEWACGVKSKGAA